MIGLTQIGFKNMVSLVKTGGMIYVSFPIAANSTVIFNANRIFSPQEILDWPITKSDLVLKRFDFVDDEGNLNLNVDPTDRNRFSSLTDGCGIYTFEKL